MSYLIVFAYYALMRADGSEVIRLTYNEAFDWDPSWGP